MSAIAMLAGCTSKGPEMLDGPGMMYIDSDYRTVYANTLPFENERGGPYWAVVFLGIGEDGANNGEIYKKKLFSDLPKEDFDKINHFDLEGDEWYLVIPKYKNECEIKHLDTGELVGATYMGEAFTIKCKNNAEISVFEVQEFTFVPQVDQEGNLVLTDDIWDVSDIIK